MGPRATALRDELQLALDEPVQATPVDGGTQLRATAPAGTDAATWRRVIAVLGGADVWGSSDTDDAPVIWARIDEDSR